MPVWTLLDRNERFQPTLEQLGNALVTSSTYDSLTGRLEQVSTNIRYTPHLAAYQYSASGKVLSRTMRTTGAPHAEADHVETYRYDGAGRLVNAANRSSNDWFAFDPLDNLTSSTDSFLAGCTLTYGQGAVLPHALTGMSCGGVERPLTYDELGRVRSYFDGNSQAEIQYTSFDKPLEVKNSSGKIRYTYGADHRAVKKEPVETYIPEPRFNGRAGAWMTNLFLGDYERRTSPGRTEHVYSVRVGGEIVAQRYWRSVGGTSREEWRYMHTDALGSPERTTSFSGDIVELYSFDPWGVLRSWAWDGNPGVAVPPDTNIGFTGHRIDYETGLIDAIGRTYNPTYKRFLTPDPFVQNPGDGATFNRFAYVQNDPVGRIDPTGFQSVDGFPIISVSSGGGATISAGGVVGSVAGWFVLSVGAIANAFSGGGDDRPPSEPRGTWLRPDASAAGGSDAVRLGGAHSAANRIADAVASGASLGGPRDLVAGEQASSGGEWGGEDFQRRVLDVLNAATPVNDAYIDGLSGITEWRRGTLKMRASPWAWGRLYNRATTGTPLGHVIETAVKDAPGAQDNAVSAVLPMGGGTRRVLGRVGREAFGTTTFRGLIQNRPLRELTHNEVYRAFAETGWTPSNHAIGRLLEYRTGAVGIETLNDVARVLNNGVVTSAGRGLYSIGLGRFEAIINLETRVIVTFSPL